MISTQLTLIHVLIAELVKQDVLQALSQQNNHIYLNEKGCKTLNRVYSLFNLANNLLLLFARSRLEFW